MELTIWIIDDDLVSQFATEYSIKQATSCASIKSFDNANDTLEVLTECVNSKRDIPDVIFLDLVMPEMSGWQLLHEISKFPTIKNKLHVYIISSFSQSKDREQAKQNPMIRGYFDKPLTKLNINKALLSLDLE